MSTALDYSNLATHKSKNLPSPPNFSDATALKKRAAISDEARQAKTRSYEQLKDKRAWDLAISPAKSLPMNAFMLYMSGSSIQVFSVGILVMLLLNPFKALASMNTVFAPFAPASANPTATSTLSLQKAAYIGCNLLTCALGIYKCLQMGLLPTGTGDWLAFETRGMAPELSL